MSLPVSSTTPARFAKLLVLEYGERAFYWREQLGEEAVDAMTEREQEAVDAGVYKQYQRVKKFLGLESS